MNLFSKSGELDSKRTQDMSLSHYQQGGFGYVNDLLWKKKVEYWGDKNLHQGQATFDRLKQVTKDIINLSESMSQCEQDTVLYRGANADDFLELLDPQNIGSITSMKGFTSTSAESYVFNSFGEGIAFQINVPKGRYAHKIINAEFERENETILPPATYKVTNISKPQGKNYTLVEMEQNDLLDVKDLILQGLDNIKDKFPADIDKLKSKVCEYYNKRQQQIAVSEKENEK